MRARELERDRHKELLLLRALADMGPGEHRVPLSRAASACGFSSRDEAAHVIARCIMSEYVERVPDDSGKPRLRLTARGLAQASLGQGGPLTPRRISKDDIETIRALRRSEVPDDRIAAALGIDAETLRFVR